MKDDEEEFCLNSRRWMFKRGFQIIHNCPRNLFGAETSCPANCGYLEVRKMPARIRRQKDLWFGRSTGKAPATGEEGTC